VKDVALCKYGVVGGYSWKAIEKKLALNIGGDWKHMGYDVDIS